ncbi:MAG TPA: glutaminyl-peptide cyclotransferase [Ferruginibacter sp.]|nr:glutaminyl-peptide cyclotransferase [Ferruginibacter sp.]
MKLYAALVILIALASCNGDDDKEVIDDSAKPIPTPIIKYDIIAVYPHDTSAYTQGLEFYKGKLYEGTGDYSESSLRITDIKTGKVEKKHMIGKDSIFGEGITIFKDKLYQLTWQSHIVYVYDVNNIDKPIKTFNWPYEGWGITNNGTDLIISDGSANLYFVNPDDFKLKTTISVSDNGGPIDSINELEYIGGSIYANVYQSEFILKIDPSSGHVLGKMELPGLAQKFFANQYIPNRTDVLNGIAYDTATKRMFITGKRWPKLFEVKMN